MSNYIINYSGGNITLTPGNANVETGLTFMGQNYSNYGGPLNQNWLSLQENFASNVSGPNLAIKGMLWYDDANGVLKLNTTNGLANWQYVVTTADANGNLTLDVLSVNDVNAVNVSGDGAGLSNINASNLASGTLDASRLSGTYNIDISGVADTANYAGNVTVASQPNITSVGTLTNLTVSGNISAGNTNITGNLAVTGTISGNISGNVSGNFTVPGSNTQVLYNVQGLAGASPNLTFNGSTLTVNGNVNATNLSGNGAAISSITGSSVTGAVAYATVANSVAGANVSGTVANAAHAVNADNATNATLSTVAVNITASAQPNITSIGTLSGLGVSGSITAVNITANTGIFSGNGSGLSSITGANVTGTVANAAYALNAGNAVNSTNATNAVNATTAGTVTTGAQPNITSVGTLTNLAVSGNMSAGNSNVSGAAYIGGNLNVAGTIYGNVQGNISGNLVVPGANTQVLFNNQGNAGASANLTFNGNTLTVLGNIDAYHLIGNGARLSSITGANVTGQVSHAAVANSVSGSNVSGTVANASYAATAGTVAGANVTGVVANANYAAFAGTAFNVTAANVVGTVANANHAAFAGTAFSVSGSNVSGTVANANFATFSSHVTDASQPNITSVGTLTGLVVSGSANANTLNISSVANIGGNLNVSGLITGNVVGNISGNIAVTGSNTEVLFNNAGNVGASSNLTFNGSTLTVTGNANATNFYGNGSGLTNITGSNVTGQVGFAAVANSVAGANVTGTVANASHATSAGTANTVTQSAQSNITSLGTLTGLNVSAQVNATTFSSNVATGTAPLSVLSTTKVANLNADLLDDYTTSVATIANTIPVRDASGNIYANTLIVNSISASSLLNGNSNVAIPAANGNVIISAAGNANVVVVTGTGVNVAGTINVSGNANVGNIGANNGVFTNVSGNGANLTAINASNISSGTLAQARLANSSLTVNGVSITLGGSGTVTANTNQTLTLGTHLLGGSFNGGAAVTASVDATSAATANKLVVRDANGSFSANIITANIINATINGHANTSNTVTDNAQPNITSVGTLTSLGVSGTITAANITANTGVFTGNGSALSALNASNITTGTLAQARLANSNVIINGTTISLGGTATITANTAQSHSNGAYITGGSFNGGTAVTWAVDATDAATANKVVARDANGSFSANVITANTFSGVVIGNGASLTNLNASNITTGTLAQARLANANIELGNVIATLGSSVANITGLTNLGANTVTAVTLVSNVATGTAPLTVTSTTRVSNLNVAYANVADFVNIVNGTNAAAVYSPMVSETVITGNTQLRTLGNDLLFYTNGNIKSNGNIVSNNLSTTNKITAGNGLQVTTGSMDVLAGNLNVTGNINVTGNLNYSNVTDLVIGDPLIYIGANNTGDSVDLGIVASYNNGTYRHTGLARNTSDDIWTFYDNVVAEPTTVIDWANATYPTVKMGTLVATGNANITGNITANAAVFTTVSGNGANLTNLNASNLASGTVPLARLSGITTTQLSASAGITNGQLANSSITVNGTAISLGGSGTVTANTTQTLTRGTYLTGSNFNGGAATTWAVDATDAATANKVVARDANGSFSANVITANSFSGVVIGNGANLTNLNASNISSGTLAQARLANSSLTVNGTSISLGSSGTITANTTQSLSNGSYLTGGSFNGGTAITFAVDATNLATANKVVARDANGSFAANVITANTFSGIVIGDGANLANLNASNITTGTLSQARLANSSLTVNGTSISLGGSATITANTPQSHSNGAYITGGSFNGSSAITWAVDAATTATANKVVARDTNGSFAANVITANSFSGPFTGNGANLTDLNASNLASGTVPLARLSGITTTQLSASAGITNGQLANSSITVNGTSISLGGSGTITANTGSSLTFNNGGSGAASGTTFNGSSAVTVSYNTVGAPSTTGTNASGTWGINITGSAGSASLSTGTSGGAIQSWDIRTIAPANMSASRMGFGFTSWTNNNNPPYADYLHLRSYTDSSGGNDNLVMFRKDAIGMRIYQQAFGSSTAYSSFKDVAWTDGTNASGTWGISITGSASTAGTVTTAAQPNITSVGTLTSLSSSGNITAPNVTANTGYFIGSVQTGISAAGSTQGTATALTRQYNVVSTVSAGQGVVLPAAVAGMRLTVINTSAANLLIYPNSSPAAQINSLATNAAFTLGGNTNAIDLVAVSTTQWYTINAVYA